MSLPLIVALLVVCAPEARAERAIVADVAAVAPFDRAELEAAIRLRIPATGSPVRVRVSATPDGVRIEARGNAREVALRGLTGAAAARFVALAADDLLADDLAVAPLGPPSLTARVAPRPSAPTTLGVLGGAAAWPYALGSLGLDLAIPAGRWVVAIDAGGGTLVGAPVDLTAAVVRIGGGARVGWLELRAGATFAPLFVSYGAGDRTVLAGAGASARVRAPIAANVTGVLAAGVDAFATRTTYMASGTPVLTTPRSAPWLAIGLEVTP